MHELEEHMTRHKYFSCEICYTGFVSDTILIQHKLNYHPEPPQKEPEQPPVPKEEPDETISEVMDLQFQETMRLIQVPDPDPLDDNFIARVGSLYRDSDHKVQCEECSRFLKNRR